MPESELYEVHKSGIRRLSVILIAVAVTVMVVCIVALIIGALVFSKANNLKGATAGPMGTIHPPNVS